MYAYTSGARAEGHQLYPLSWLCWGQKACEWGAWACYVTDLNVWLWKKNLPWFSGAHKIADVLNLVIQSTWYLNESTTSQWKRFTEVRCPDLATRDSLKRNFWCFFDLAHRFVKLHLKALSVSLIFAKPVVFLVTTHASRRLQWRLLGRVLIDGIISWHILHIITHRQRI